MDKKRRKLLLTGAAALGQRALPRSLGIPLVAHSASVASQVELPGRFQFDPVPFTLGVASGDPTPDSVVIWTRFAPDPLAPDGLGGMTSDVTVWYAVATDDQFNNLVDMNAVTAKVAEGGTVHVDVTGLDPDTVYYYMFWDDQQVTSVIGCTKTAPSGVLNQVRFALASCQKINVGLFGAFERMVEEDLDFILHVGDYIYESALPSHWPEEMGLDPLFTLEDYRLRHAVYKADPQLRAAHQAVPWIATWDDHEVSNDYWNMTSPGFIARRNDAYQAWYEHMPIRAPAGPPDELGFRIHRQLVFGDLLDLTVLDTRQYRDEQPEPLVDDFNDPNRTLLGAEQKQWLKDKLSASTANWRCIAQQVLMAQVNTGGVEPGADGWPGYAAERAEILGHISTNGIQNVVVLTGDAHQSLVANLKVNFDDLFAPNVATEFLTTSVTSTSGARLTGVDGLDTAAVRALIYPLNLHVRYTESELHGYVVCDVTKQKWTSTYRAVDRTTPNAPAQTLAVFEVNNGVPTVNQISGGGGNPLPALP